MMGVGDLIQQKTELFKKNICESKVKIKVDDLEDKSFDLIRTRNMTTVGIMQGPFNHYFYTILDRFLPGKNTFSIMKKTILDQTIASPTCLGIFFVGLGYLEQKNIKDITAEISHKIFDVWKVSISLKAVFKVHIPIRFMYIQISSMFLVS